MSNSIDAANIGVAATRQQLSQPVTTATRSLDRPQIAERGSPREVDDESNAQRRDRRGATVSWYGKLLIVSMLLTGAAWEVFKLILTIITLD
jgi:hypothetical protein